MRRDDYLKGPAAKVIGAVVAVLAVLFIASQLIIPPTVEDNVAERLTKEGGTADVEVSAFPAIQLLWSDGRKIKVRGEDLGFDLTNPPKDAFEKLDGFDEVDVEIKGSRTGPVEIESFRLERSQEGTQYDLSIMASVTGEDLAAFAGEQVGGSIGEFFGNLAGGAIPEGDREIPIEADVELRSEGGRAEVEDAEGSIGGIPLGPFAGLIAETIVDRF